MEKIRLNADKWNDRFVINFFQNHMRDRSDIDRIF